MDLTTTADRMDRLEGYPFEVWHSPGAQAEAADAAGRAARALDWLVDALGWRPPVRLFVAGPLHWADVAEVQIYGMPQAFGGRIVVGTEPAGFWSDTVDLLWPSLPDATRTRIHDVYGDPPDLTRFAGLIIAHELAHVFHYMAESRGESDFPRLWVAELFANIGLCGYVAEVEPEARPTLGTICEAARELPPERFPVRGVDAMEATLEHGAEWYVGYEFLLCNFAQRIWDGGGVQAFRAFYETLRRPGLTDAELRAALAAVHPEAERVLTDWST